MTLTCHQNGRHDKLPKKQAESPPWPALANLGVALAKFGVDLVLWTESNVLELCFDKYQHAGNTTPRNRKGDNRVALQGTTMPAP